MTDGSGPSRGYTEKEIGALIQRATALQNEATGSSERILKLDEVAHIASELGVPPEYLHAAARELEEGRVPRKRLSFWGGPFEMSQSRHVAGVLSDDLWAEIVLELRRFAGAKGETSRLGKGREWRHAVGEGEGGITIEQLDVSLIEKEGATSIDIRKRYGGVVATYMAAFFFTGLLAIGVAHKGDWSFGVDLAMTAGMLATAFGVVRSSVWLWAKRFRPRLRDLTARIQKMILDADPAPAASEPSVAETTQVGSPVSDRIPDVAEMPARLGIEEIDAQEPVQRDPARRSSV